MHGKVTQGAARKSSREGGDFGSAGCEVEKNDDRFPVAKSRPPLIVVIKIGPGKWAPFFSEVGVLPPFSGFIAFCGVSVSFVKWPPEGGHPAGSPKTHPAV